VESCAPVGRLLEYGYKGKLKQTLVVTARNGEPISFEEAGNLGAAWNQSCTLRFMALDEWGRMGEDTLVVESSPAVSAEVARGIEEDGRELTEAIVPEAEVEAEEETMEVTVPEGMGACETLELMLPGGASVEVAIPEGLGPGDTFEVSLGQPDGASALI
jgi:hypothetical protein